MGSSNSNSEETLKDWSWSSYWMTWVPSKERMEPNKSSRASIIDTSRSETGSVSWNIVAILNKYNYLFILKNVFKTFINIFHSLQNTAYFNIRLSLKKQDLNAMIYYRFFRFMMFNVTLNNISVISWR